MLEFLILACQSYDLAWAPGQHQELSTQGLFTNEPRVDSSRGWPRALANGDLLKQRFAVILKG